MTLYSSFLAPYLPTSLFQGPPTLFLSLQMRWHTQSLTNLNAFILQTAPALSLCNYYFNDVIYSYTLVLFTVRC